MLIGDDQDNGGDKSSHETDESFSGRGGYSSYVMLLHKQVMCHTSEQYRTFYLLVPSHYFQSQAKRLVESRTYERY